MHVLSRCGSPSVTMGYNPRINYAVSCALHVQESLVKNVAIAHFYVGHDINSKYSLKICFFKNVNIWVLSYSYATF